METLSPEILTQASFPKAIDLCKKQEAKFKNQEVKKQKYSQMRKKLEKSREKLDDTIEATKSIEMKSGKKFFDEFVSGKEEAVSLEWLGKKLEEQKDNIKEGKVPSIASSEIDVVHVDFVDQTKQVWHDLTHGKGLAKGLFTAVAGIGIGEVLTRGITSSLVKEGVLQSSMGLMGLGQMAWQNLPMAWQSISGAMSSFFAWSPIAAVSAGALIALKAVPMIRGMVDRIKSKAKSVGEFENNMKKLIEEQKGMEAAK